MHGSDRDGAADAQDLRVTDETAVERPSRVPILRQMHESDVRRLGIVGSMHRMQTPAAGSGQSGDRDSIRPQA
jgi:hypothetical protein